MHEAAGETLTIVFPMWNEIAIIDRSIDVAHDAAGILLREGAVDDYEIVVVDDASTDGSAEHVAELALSDDRLRLVRHDRNRKLGAAMRSGFDAAKGSVVLVTGADLPFDLRELSTAFHLLSTYDADIVAAYRFHRTGEGVRRWVYSYLYNALAKGIFGLRVRDVNFSAKLVRADVLDAIELRSEGSFIDVELLVRAQRAGFRTVQFGVDSFPRWTGRSTLASAGVIATMLREMVTIGPHLGRPPTRRP